MQPLSDYGRGCAFGLCLVLFPLRGFGDRWGGEGSNPREILRAMVQWAVGTHCDGGRSLQTLHSRGASMGVPPRGACESPTPTRPTATSTPHSEKSSSRNSSDNNCDAHQLAHLDVVWQQRQAGDEVVLEDFGIGGRYDTDVAHDSHQAPQRH
eukprot:365422-Chlamydomonas_euryale.AAC.4